MSSRINVIKVFPGRPFQFRIRLGSTLFKAIVKIKGIEYRRGEGFVITSYDAIPKVNALIERFNVMLIPYIPCVICGKDVHCETCEYSINCRKDLEACICKTCLNQSDAWRKYSEIQKTNLDIK